MSETLIQLRPSSTHSAPAPTTAPAWALWALGFRPFYLLAALLAALSVPLWALQFAGWLPAPAALPGALWHGHEMVFGYTLAVVVGFLFTAGRNWSGQPTPVGRPLMLLAGLWLLARVLMFTPYSMAAALVNIAVPWLAAWGLWRALRAGGNSRNYFFVGLLVLMGVAAGAVHLSAHGGLHWPAGLGLPLALDVVLFMIAVMAGRVVPMFSNNGVPGLHATRHPHIEKLALGSVLVLAVLDAAQNLVPGLVPGLAPGLAPGLRHLTAATCVIALTVHTYRWWLWQPWKTLSNPLVWVLHAAYLWVPVHLALRAAAAWGGVAPSAATHALTAGSIGLITLGMMTRTALGHTGRPLRAGRIETTAYALVLAAAIIRVGLPLVYPPASLWAISLSACAWSLAFVLYLVRYTPILLKARVDGLPG